MAVVSTPSPDQAEQSPMLYALLHQSIMVSATSSAASPLNLLIAIICCAYLSCEVESFSLHQSSLSAATRNHVAVRSQQQQFGSSSTSLFMSDAALSLTGQEGT